MSLSSKNVFRLSLSPLAFLLAVDADVPSLSMGPGAVLV